MSLGWPESVGVLRVRQHPVSKYLQKQSTGNNSYDKNMVKFVEICSISHDDNYRIARRVYRGVLPTLKNYAFVSGRAETRLLRKWSQSDFNDLGSSRRAGVPE